MAGTQLGIAASWVTERIDASMGLIVETPIHFSHHLSVKKAGVLCLIPALIAQGLLSFKSHLSPLVKGYYDLQFTVMTLALMYLLRIKNPEQLKQHNPGDFGKIMGLDRVPEVRCLRSKIKQITGQNKSVQWSEELAKEWLKEQEEPYIFYVDGHVKVYHGYKANLGRKHIARQKLCMPGMSEFWVNNFQGLPYAVVMGEVNEKLMESLRNNIIPRLMELSRSESTEKRLSEDACAARFILVFDREAYSPAFFKELWEQYRIAVITYRKNVVEMWDEKIFSEHKVEVEGREIKMRLTEKQSHIGGVQMREIRKLSENNHQTSVITTYFKMTTERIAYYMFSRWSQENFFWYLRQDYDLDRMIEYSVKQLDSGWVVVNPMYSKVTHRIKKIREKIQRRKARMFQLDSEAHQDGELPDKATIRKKAELSEELQQLEQEEKQLINERQKYPYRITIKDMPPDMRYTKLNTEAKLFQNIIKMICYRAETCFGKLLTSHYKRSDEEMRMLVKQIINVNGDIMPDYSSNRLVVKLYSLSRPRDNYAVAKVCSILNDTQTTYPGTDLVLNYQMATG